MNYTKGEWKANLFGVSVNGYVVADCYPKGRNPTLEMVEVEANANLIAAAPDMYEALERLVLDVTDVHSPIKNNPTYARSIYLAQQALAKAEGKEV